MGIFSDKLLGTFPTVKESRDICKNGYIKKEAVLKWDGKNKVKIPYLEEIQDFVQKNTTPIPGKILMITDKEHVAVTAAAYINDYLYASGEDMWYEEEWADDGIYYEDEPEEKKLRIISLQKSINTEKSVLNRYLPCLTDVDENRVVLFTGLTGTEEMQEKLEIMETCPTMINCVQVNPKQLQEPWVQELLMEHNYCTLCFSELKQEYYEQVLQYLLENQEYQLQEGLSPKLLVRKMSKRRGKKFCERDIAWYLDKALENANKNHPKTSVLKEEDFGPLALGEKRPMELLQEMTGIQSVKRMAREIAALVQEGIYNDKLGTLHKNMLFLGNPGTGKTTCAKLIADIMAEEGENNTAFVVAGRKDLIGEYVGHTSPKVASKFEEARGGVLFVDEAGFFLNTNAGGYVIEAIKEFVRYMEIYPDVTVIFAMYPQEAKRFLELDEGLASRISRFVDFEDYSNEELGHIAAKMWEQKGYEAEPGAVAQVERYMEQQRGRNKKRFGNAREVRKLAEASITAVSLRHYQSRKKKGVVTQADVEAGWELLCVESLEKQKAFGFGSGSGQLHKAMEGECNLLYARR